MNRFTPSARPTSTADSSRRTGRPLFFNGQTESTDEDVDGFVEIPLTTHLPDISFLQGATHKELRSIFKPRIHKNEEGLRFAYVNKHDQPHMDRVANGVLHIGTRLGFSATDVHAATLATRFHDIGYEFPEGAEVGDMEKLGKEIHSSHAPDGANLFMAALKKVRRTSFAVREELKDWDDETVHIAHQSIALHSNDVGTDDAAPALSLLPRFVDKIDNTHNRVRSSHIEAFRVAPFRRVQHIQRLVRAGQKYVLSEDTIHAHKRHGLSLPEVRDRLHAVDPYYVHRLVPLAIQDQRLFMNPQTVAMRLDYQVYPGAVGEVLGVEYSDEDHLQDFHAAYTRSMRNAAQVIRTIQTSMALSSGTAESQLTVRMNYDDGRRRVLEYSGT